MKKHIFISLILVGMINAGCASPVATETEEPSPIEKAAEESDDTSLALQSASSETNITIDGNPSDWGGYDVLLTDTEGDHDGGGFDIAAVRAFSNDQFLYVLIETHQLPTDYVQVDLNVFAGGKDYILSFQPQAFSTAFMGDVTSGQFEQIGQVAGSKSTAAEAVEYKMPLSAFKDTSNLKLGVRVMGGTCCEPPDWYVIDEIEQVSVPQLDEIEPPQDLTFPHPNSGQALVVEQTQVDLANARCDEPIDIVTNPDHSMAYVICRNTDMLYVIETATDQIVDTLPLDKEATNPFGLAPCHITRTPDGSLLLIANEMDKSITFISAETLSIITTLSVESGSAQSAVSPDGTLAYVVGPQSNNLTIIDLLNRKVLTTATLGPDVQMPYAVAFTPDGSAAYVGTMNVGLLRIDTTKHQVTGRIELPEAGWRGDLIINADGTTAYLAAVGYDWIAEIDLIEEQMTRKFAVQKPQALLLSEDERLLYFGTFGSFLTGIEPVGIIDLASGNLANQIPFVTPAPHVSWTADIEGLAFVGDGSRIYAPGIDADGVFLIDVAAQKQSAFIPLTDYAIRQPEKLLINSDGSTLYTVNIAPQAPSISIVDTASGKVDTQFYLEEDNPCFSQATGIALTPDDTTIYMSTSSCLLTFYTASSSFTNSIPVNISGGTIRDLVVHPDGKSVYIVDSEGVVSVIDRTSFDVISTVQAVEEGHNIKVSPDGTRVYVTGSRQYAAIDTATHTVVASDNVHVGGEEQFTSYPDRLIGIPPGHEFYTIGDFFYMQVYDAATNKLLREIDLEPWAPGRTLASDAIFSPDGNTGYLALWDLKGIAAFDTSMWELTAQIDTGYSPVFGICPNDFAFHPDGTYLYVSCEQSDNIMVIDTKTNQVINVIQLVP
ncbi:MAG: hypothetical protein J7K85_05970 [Anaerolineaceae bacterium]|nr:hypothetical protein [Anaerolineaceae bacterium]